jgi:uncharacterized membrane protein
MRLSKEKIDSFRKIRDKSGSRFYEFSTSWWGLCFFISLIGGCVLWNAFMPFNALVFDPYPFNGLRTVLALLGAIQAPILLLYSRKSTEYRKSILEQDFELEKKIYKKIENLEKELKEKNDVYLQELKKISKLTRSRKHKRKTHKERIENVLPTVESKKEFLTTNTKNREQLNLRQNENNENITA